MRTCHDNAAEFKRLKMSAIYAQIKNTDNSIFISNGAFDKARAAASLECNEQCAVIKRNRQLELALQIQNPGDVTQRLAPPNYSDFLKDWAKKDVSFVQMVHDKIVDLIRLAKEVRLAVLSAIP